MSMLRSSGDGGDILRSRMARSIQRLRRDEDEAVALASAEADEATSVADLDDVDRVLLARQGFRVKDGKLVRFERPPTTPKRSSSQRRRRRRRAP